MEIIGVIAEYNPFHNGHIYHIKKIKEQFKDSIIIAVISTSFTQRGEISILNKWDKTKLALTYGIDLVVELPFSFATQSADYFAQGALKILNDLKITKLIFGSESNNITKLIKIANQQLQDQQLKTKLKDNLKKGQNYPTALAKATTNETLEPNDLLAISYIKEIIKNNYPIEPISIQRTNQYYSKTTKDHILSASGIRNLQKEKKDITPYVPKEVLDKLYDIPDLFPYLKYKILSEQENLTQYLGVTEGIEKRLLKQITNTHSYEEFITKIKTKRYTYNRLNRMLLHILTSYTKEKRKQIKLDYIRILGFNKNGQNYLKKIKKECPLPLITKYQKDQPTMQFEYQITLLYAYFLKDETLITKELGKPVIFK